jgi:type II secretory pathway pseudopilin PulG
VTTLAWTINSILAAGLAGLALTAARTRRRLRAAEQRLTSLERQLGTVDRASRHAVDTVRAAEALARRPSTAAPPEPPRVVLEPLTGRLVKAVALGAGARRAVTRLARGPRGPRS